MFGVLIGLGQCHFVLGGCPIPNRPSVAFPGEGRSLLVIEYFAALYLADGSNRRMVKIEHYTVLRRQRRIVNGLLQVGLPRVLEYLRVLDSKKYSSNVLVLEYSFNSASGQKF